MKKIILILLVISSYQLTAQETTKSLEADFKEYFIDGVYRLISSPKINWNISKVEVGIGPTILLSSPLAVTSKKGPKLVGLQAHLRYFPNGKTNKVNLFFYEEITFQIINDNWHTNEWDSKSSNYQRFEYTNSEYLSLSNTGYGMKINISNKFAIYQSIGLGVYYSHSDSNEKSTDAPELFNEDENINGYKEFGFTFGLNFGVNYTL